MKSLVVVDPSRREMCAGALGCAVGLFVASCTSSGDVVETGGVDPDGDHPVDASEIDARATDARATDARATDARATDAQAADAAPTDAPNGPTCGTGLVDLGLPTAYVVGAPVFKSSSSVYVIRDAGGLYALSSRCTHQQVQVGISGTHFLCPAHGAQFAFSGAIISGPVNRVLVHYSLCLMANGHVGLDRTVTVAASVRLVA